MNINLNKYHHQCDGIQANRIMNDLPHMINQDNPVGEGSCYLPNEEKARRVNM